MYFCDMHYEYKAYLSELPNKEYCDNVYTGNFKQ
jgi:hypothetical protein